MELDKKMCPIIDVDGFIEEGKQFDLEVVLPEDERSVIYGLVKDCHQKPVKDAVVKLIEVCKEYGKEERKPVTHTFTDKEGQFVFGPICPDKYYELQIWVNRVKHFKVCANCKHEGKCLKGIDMECECYEPKYYDKEKYDKYEKENKYEREEKYDKDDKWDKYDKCEKENKYDKEDKYNKEENDEKK